MNKKNIIPFLLTILVVWFFYWIAGEVKREKFEKEQENKVYLKENKSVILEEEKKYPIQSRDHIKIGESHVNYITNPPLSGAHSSASRGGFYPDGLLDENAIHNLEHGYTWISYKNISKEGVDDIKKISEKFSGSVIASLRMKNNFDGVAVASWGNLLKLKKFDRIMIEDFIKRNKNKSPEKLAK